MTTPTQAQIEAALRAFHNVHHSCGIFVRMTAALTAAAEGREECGCGYDQPSDVCMLHEPIIKAWVADTIERCAQMAHDWTGTPSTLAAAIRAMKDDEK